MKITVLGSGHGGFAMSSDLNILDMMLFCPLLHHITQNLNCSKV